MSGALMPNLTDHGAPGKLSVVARPKTPRGESSGGKMTNVRLSAAEQAEILRAIEIQMEGTTGLIANPAAFLRDAGLKEARRILAAKGKK